MGALASCGTQGKVHEGLVRRTPSAPATPVKSAAEERGERLSLEAMELLKDADSIRLGVEMTAPEGHKEVSVHMDRRGNCTGTFDSAPREKGDLIMIGGEEVYFHFADESLDAIRDAAAARGPEIAARARERTALARGKYVKVPKDTARPGAGSAAVTKMCDLDSMLGQLDAGSGEESGMGVGGRVLPERRWHGQRVTPIAATDGGHEMTVYLAAGDKPYIVGMTQKRGDELMEMRMSDYDKPVAAQAPDPSLVVDLEALGVGAGGSLFEV
jgi:hypothetical protein